MENIEYLDNFELGLLEKLTLLCRSYGKLKDIFPSSQDIDDFWQVMAPEYLADAVQQVRDYPVVSVAWASYFGMAVANGWDKDWKALMTTPYNEFYGSRGFDDMDEHIVADILGIPLNTPQSQELEDMVRRCGELAIDLIRHEDVEPQSPLAYHIFARACRAMFRIGAAWELERLGYKMQPLNMQSGMPS